MQKVIIAGRLGRKPETRFTASGQKIASFTMATNDRKGEADITTWWRVTVFGDRFDRMVAKLDKGSALIVSGKFRQSNWTDKEGKERTSLEVIADSLEFSPFGGKSQQGEEFTAQEPAPATAGAFQPQAGQGEAAIDDSDPIPF